MRICSLAGLTKEGRRIVKRHGERWECLRVEPTVRFSPLAGPWYLLVPIDEPRVHRTVREARLDTGTRWVHAFDPDLKVMP